MKSENSEKGSDIVFKICPETGWNLKRPLLCHLDNIKNYGILLHYKIAELYNNILSQRIHCSYLKYVAVPQQQKKIIKKMY